MIVKKITKVEQQTKNKKRFNIYINDSFAFAVHEDVLVAYSLFTGKEIEEDYLEEVLQEEEKNKVWQKSLKYLNYKPRTEMEVKKHLMNKGYSVELIELIIDKLRKDQLINDKLYAEQFINQRISYNPKGKRLLAYELKNKGINSTDIQESLEQVDENMEYDLAIKLVKKRGSLYNGGDWISIQRKIGSFLGRRGFSFDVINKMLQENKDDFMKSP